MNSIKYDMYKINSLNQSIVKNVYQNIDYMSDFLKQYKSILFISIDYPGYGGAATNCANLQKFFSKSHKTYAIYYSNRTKEKETDKYSIVDPLNLKLKIEEHILLYDVVILKFHCPIDLRIYNKPVLFLIPGIYNDYINKYYYNLTKEEHERFISKNIIDQIKKSDYIFVNSYHTQKLLKKYCKYQAHLFYSSFVNFYKIQPKISENKRKYKYGIIVSDFTRRTKNLKDSFKIINDNDGKVILIGKGSCKFKNKRIECFDLMSNEELQKMYENIEYIIQTSYYESCSNVKVEAMYAGCKILL